MARSLWDVFLSIFRRDSEDDDSEKDGFSPSPMDLSVREGHGGSDAEIQRELNNIEQQAQELEDQRR